MSKKIKSPKSSVGKNIGLSPSSNAGLNIEYPVFCFKYLHKNHHLDSCTEMEKAALIDRLARLSAFKWSELIVMDRHKLGSEKIALSAIKTTIPPELTADVSFLLAFRFKDMAPFVGHRRNFVFHIIYIDRDFTLYNH